MTVGVDDLCLCGPGWLTPAFLACLTTPLACGLEEQQRRLRGAAEKDHPHHSKGDSSLLILLIPTLSEIIVVVHQSIYQMFLDILGKDDDIVIVLFLILVPPMMVTIYSNNFALSQSGLSATLSALSRYWTAPPSPSLSKVKNSIMHGTGRGQLFLAICPSHVCPWPISFDILPSAQMADLSLIGQGKCWALFSHFRQQDCRSCPFDAALHLQRSLFYIICIKYFNIFVWLCCERISVILGVSLGCHPAEGVVIRSGFSTWGSLGCFVLIGFDYNWASLVVVEASIWLAKVRWLGPEALLPLSSTWVTCAAPCPGHCHRHLTMISLLSALCPKFRSPLSTLSFVLGILSSVELWMWLKQFVLFALKLRTRFEPHVSIAELIQI